jgi:chromosome segregation ATPase
MSKLKRLLELRNAISKLEFEVQGLMPDAIDEAIYVLGSENSKKQTVFKSETGKIVLVFKKQYATPLTDLKLNKLEADIRRVTAKLSQDNAEKLSELEAEIEKHKQAIAQLESEMQKLTSNRYVTRLKNEYNKHREETMTLAPSLSVFL